MGVLALAIEPAAAPPTAQGADCPRNIEEWERVCLMGGRRAGEAMAIARMRGATAVDGASILSDAENVTVDAARACARAERWSEAERLLGLAGLAAVERSGGDAWAAKDAEGAVSCSTNAVRRSEHEAFEAYRQAMRSSAVFTASASKCATPAADTLGATLQARRSADEARCGWLLEAGRARAMEGTVFLSKNDEINGLLSLSSALGAYNRAQRVCSGEAVVHVSKVRGRLATLVMKARAGGANVAAEAREVRAVLRDQSADKLVRLAPEGSAPVGVDATCHESGARVVMAGRQPLRLSDGND